MQFAVQPELIIFDLDGTLADTIQDIAASVNRTLAHFHFEPHSVDAYKLMVGEGFRLLIQKALPKGYSRDESMIQRVLEWALKDYSENCLVETALFPGVLETLTSLSTSGYKLAVLSNKPDPMTKFLVGELCGSIDFIAVLGNSAERPRKPDPATALQIAALAGAASTRSLFVGDSATDMQTAKSAAMISVGALYGYRSHEELARAGAKYFIGSPLELLNLLHPPRIP